MGLLFGATWLSQIVHSALSGKTPSDLAAYGWSMNPIYVLDLGFVLPLALLAGSRLLAHRIGGASLAVPLLVFIPLLAGSILMLVIAEAISGQTLAVPVIAIFGIGLVVSGALAWSALRTKPAFAIPASGRRVLR